MPKKTQPDYMKELEKSAKQMILIHRVIEIDPGKRGVVTKAVLLPILIPQQYSKV